MKTRIYKVTLAGAASLVEANSATAALKIVCDDVGSKVDVASAKDVANLFDPKRGILRAPDAAQQSLPGA